MGRELHDGRRDGLVAVQSLNPDEIRSFSDLLDAMGRTSFGGRRLGEAFAVMQEMILDPDCYVVGIFTVGGGVPRNWAQQVGSYMDITNVRVGTGFTPPRFKYGVRICPEPDYWGGLSGCTYSEGVSWGKFVPPEEGGRFAEVLSDATLVWPLLVKGLLESLEKRSGAKGSRGQGAEG